MKKILIYMSCLAIGFSSPVWAEETAQFFASIPDLPLKEGLIELEDQTLSFDKPQGRIIETIAQIKSGDEKEIKQYYEDALPQIGWRKESSGVFKRKREYLKIEFENFEKKRFMRVMIEPQ